MHAAFLVENPESGTVSAVVEFVVGFAGGISAVVLFVPQVSVVFEVHLECGELLYLDYFSLTAHILGDKRNMNY